MIEKILAVVRTVVNWLNTRLATKPNLQYSKEADGMKPPLEKKPNTDLSDILQIAQQMNMSDEMLAHSFLDIVDRFDKLDSNPEMQQVRAELEEKVRTEEHFKGVNPQLLYDNVKVNVILLHALHQAYGENLPMSAEAVTKQAQSLLRMIQNKDAILKDLMKNVTVN